jgi:hypothetical protein
MHHEMNDFLVLCLFFVCSFLFHEPPHYLVVFSFVFFISMKVIRRDLRRGSCITRHMNHLILDLFLFYDSDEARFEARQLHHHI